ncbi:MAG: rod shape-determining protein MreD [Paracoccaceae bacterium]
MPVISITRYWVEITLFILCGFVAIGAPMIPMGLTADSMAFPDVLYGLIVAWVIRRPATAPMLLVVFLGVLADAMLMRPIGLWAMLLLISTEALRFVERSFRDIPFLLEWLYISGLLVLLVLLQNLLLFASFSDVPAGFTTFWHVVRTIAIYPVIVAILHWVVRVRVPKRDVRPNRVGIVL